MRLFYRTWNFPKNKAHDIMGQVIKTDPFNQIFNELLPRQSCALPEKRGSPNGEGALYNAWPVAQWNAVNTSEERLVILTTNDIVEGSSFSKEELLIGLLLGYHFYGISYRNEGVVFARPIKHDGLDSQDVDIPYGIELVCHELSGQFFWTPKEKCRDRKCFSYGVMERQSDGTAIPPYGRNHFCKRHRDAILRSYEKMRQS